MRRILMLVMTLAATFLSAQPLRAATILFDIILDGLQETPPVATTGYGSGSLSLNDATGDYIISGVFADLIGTANNAHIHGPAPPGTPAGVVHGLTFTPAASGVFNGANTFTGPQMTNLLAEQFYVNIHSTFKTGGEIRGQILQQVPEPGSIVLVACGGAALIVACRRRRARA